MIWFTQNHYDEASIKHETGFGICCLEDDTCILLCPEDCLAAQGTRWGGIYECDPNPCDQPQGACCFADGTCLVLTEDDCFEPAGKIFDTLEDAREFGENEVNTPWMIVKTHFWEKGGYWKRIVHRTRTMIPGSPQNDIRIQDVSF